MIEVRTTIGFSGVPAGSVIDVPDDDRTARRIERRIYIPTGQRDPDPAPAPAPEDAPDAPHEGLDVLLGEGTGDDGDVTETA